MHFLRVDAFMLFAVDNTWCCIRLLPGMSAYFCMHPPSECCDQQVRATEEKRQGNMANKEVQLPFVQISEPLQQAKVQKDMRPEQATQTTDVKADLWKVARRKASIEVFLHSSMYCVTDLCPCLMRATFLA